MSTKTPSTTPAVPERAVQETKPGLADRVDSAVDTAQVKLDAAIDAAQDKARAAGESVTDKAVEVRDQSKAKAVDVLDSTQTQVDKGFDKAKDALQK